MSTWFWIATMLFAGVALALVLIILVQRPQGGGLAGAFGGAGGSSTETVFGGRVGDALTYATIAAFVLYIGMAIGLSLLDEAAYAPAATSPPPGQVAPATDDATPTGSEP